jgi:N-methylhydantoinase A
VFDGPRLGAGASIPGPAVIDYPVTTVVVPPGATAEVDSLGNVLIDVGIQGSAPAELAASTTTAS